MTDGQSECCQWNGPFERKRKPMTEYDEPIENLKFLPKIVRDRLHVGGLKTIRQTQEWLKNPTGTALTPQQILMVRESIEQWDTGQ